MSEWVSESVTDTHCQWSDSGPIKNIFFLSYFHIHMPSSELIIFVLNKNMFKRYFPNSVFFWTKADLLKQKHFCLLYKIFSPFLLPVICGGRHRRSPSVIIKVWSNIKELVFYFISFLSICFDNSFEFQHCARCEQCWYGYYVIPPRYNTCKTMISQQESYHFFN